MVDPNASFEEILDTAAMRRTPKRLPLWACEWHHKQYTMSSLHCITFWRDGPPQARHGYRSGAAGVGLMVSYQAMTWMIRHTQGPRISRLCRNHAFLISFAWCCSCEARRHSIWTDIFIRVAAIEMTRYLPESHEGAWSDVCLKPALSPRQDILSSMARGRCK